MSSYHFPSTFVSFPVISTLSVYAELLKPSPPPNLGFIKCPPCGILQWSLGIPTPDRFLRASENEQIPEMGFIQGPDCGLHPGGVAATASCSEAPVQGCDSGKLQAAGLHGVSC